MSKRLKSSQSAAAIRAALELARIDAERRAQEIEAQPLADRKSVEAEMLTERAQ